MIIKSHIEITGIYLIIIIIVIIIMSNIEMTGIY